MSPEKEKLKLVEEDLGDGYKVAFQGDIDLYTLENAKELIGRIVDAGHDRLIFDMEGVRYVDSSGLGLFVGSLKKVRERGGDIRIINLNAYMQGIFKLINLHKVLTVDDDQDAALAALRGLARPRG